MYFFFTIIKFDILEAINVVFCRQTSVVEKNYDITDVINCW